MAAIGHFAATGTPAATSVYAHAAGVVGAVNVPAGAWLLGLTAWAVAAGATVQIDARPAVGIPAGGSFTQDIGGGIVGPAVVTFVGTSQYFVEWLDWT